MSRLAAGSLSAVLVLVLVALVALASLGPLESGLAVGAAVVLIAGAVLAARFDTDDLGTGVITVAMLTNPMFSGIFKPTIITVSDVLFAAGFALLLPRLLRCRLRIPGIWALGLTILICAGLASTPASDYPTTGMLRMLSMVVTIAGLPVMMMWWNPPKRILVRLVTAYVIGQGISMIAGIALGEAATNRLEGLTTHPNAFGMLAVFAVTLLLFLHAEVRQERRWVIWAGLALNGAGVVLSGSRAALLALVIVMLAVPIIEKSAKVVYLYAVGAAVMLVAASALLSALGPNSAPNRLLHPDQSTSGAAGSIDQRSALLSQGWHAFLQHPIVGNGFGGTYTFFYHNVFLEFMAAAGLIGLLGYLLVIGTTLAPLFGTGPLRRLGYCALGYLVVSMFSPTISERWIWAVLALPLLVAANGQSSRETSGAPRPATLGTTPRKAQSWTTHSTV
ncbi:O-antigen ligase family protein [Nocardioides terrisoli]|uniref:O-antigen ligase family protein n=1 Tax=Nocardioides terrisoli TaxID=3388267 RepID=UPI00287B902D|nr:O-antigen ligase family protein [Nocardioides marmorisolisilvae]